ncbi:hypothetical protein GCM10009831_03700 [Dietzia cercidiphylli]|uniref:Uncharacterized protein n=1 Tax=Dietzia cercidiphylli TaxID=498199 RepID=A0ABN2I596_9ACTN
MVELALNRNAIRRSGSHARNSSSPTRPPSMWTVRVVPTPYGGSLVQTTLVITPAQRGHESASTKISNSCRGVAGIATLLVKRNRAVSVYSTSTGSQGCMVGIAPPLV